MVDYSAALYEIRHQASTL